MKKNRWIVTLLAVALAFGMVGVFAVSCGDGDTDSTDTTELVTTTDDGRTFTGDDAFVVSVGMPSSASLYNTYLVPWTDAIAESSNGRVEFTLHSANTLVKEELQIDAVITGTSDITVFQADWAPAVFPLVELGGMPMLFPSTEVAVKVMWQLIEEYGQEELEDFKLLGLGFITASQWGGKEEAKTPADLVGKRIRSGGATETEAIEALGGTPVEAGTDSLATQLERNAFDGLFLSWSFHAGNTNAWSTNWTETNMFLRPLVFVMSRDKWNSLPLAVQQAFEENTSIEDALKYNAVEGEYIKDNLNVPELKDRGLDRNAIVERAASLGTEVYELSAAERAEWQTALEPVLENWVEMYASKLDTQTILDRCLELIDEYSASGGDAEATATTAAE